MDDSVSTAPNTIIIRPGISPNCFTAAGRAMIPAPTIVVERLNTAPENDAPSKPASLSSRFWGKSGALGLRRNFLSAVGIVIVRWVWGCGGGSWEFGDGFYLFEEVGTDLVANSALTSKRIKIWACWSFQIGVAVCTLQVGTKESFAWESPLRFGI